MIKLQGDVDIVAFASCGWDSKFKMLTCKSEPLSIPHLPGTTQRSEETKVAEVQGEGC